jgi:PRTRC genetic system protein E
MFTELRSLLARRSLTIMVAAVDEGQIRVNVIPHPRPEEAKINEQIKYSHKDEVAPVPDTAIKALTTPISLTGTAEEIDENFSGVLLRFAESHTRLQATFDRASVEISEAVKAIDERNMFITLCTASTCLSQTLSATAMHCRKRGALRQNPQKYFRDMRKSCKRKSISNCWRGCTTTN